MPLPSSGSISASEIKNEFGTNNSPQIRIGQYRDATTHGGKQWPFDVDIPIGTGSNDTTTTIKFSDFRGKQLNTITVIDGSDENRVTAAKEDKEVVGGLKSSTSKSVRAKARNIIYVVNKTIGSEKGSRNKCALRTGTSNDWYGTSEQKSPKINIELGEGAKLYGAGGDGGDGKKHSSNGENGENGTSALGIEVATESIVVGSGANIIAGGGGGGGGGGGKETSETEGRRAGGGGGGGGAGIPAGQGGTGFNYNSNDSAKKNGEDGDDGGQDSAGDGGNGRSSDEECRGGGGGGGSNLNGTDGSAGEGGDESEDGANGTNSGGGNGGEGHARESGTNPEESEGGSGGLSGYAITSSGNLAINVTVGSSRVKGTQQQNGGVS
jgi:hypothetical protein